MVETAWQLYDDLIDLIPAELTVTDALLSRVALVRNSAGGVGTASNDGGGGREEADDRPVVGRPLRDVAALVRSWDFALASLGVAALNSWLNSAERLDAVGNLDGVRVDRRDVDVFAARASELAGLRVATPRSSRCWKGSPAAVISRTPRASSCCLGWTSCSSRG